MELVSKMTVEWELILDCAWATDKYYEENGFKKTGVVTASRLFHYVEWKNEKNETAVQTYKKGKVKTKTVRFK